jgi:hypothetical protein
MFASSIAVDWIKFVSDSLVVSCHDKSEIHNWNIHERGDVHP